ncbi:hypothetical protein Bca101_070924 [Brassica carinata]
MMADDLDAEEATHVPGNDNVGGEVMIIVTCLEAAIDAAEDPVRLRHVLLPRLERADESEDEQPKDLSPDFVETKELGEILDVASKSMEGIVQNIGNFLPKLLHAESDDSSQLSQDSTGKSSKTNSKVSRNIMDHD